MTTRTPNLSYYDNTFVPNAIIIQAYVIMFMYTYLLICTDLCLSLSGPCWPYGPFGPYFVTLDWLFFLLPNSEEILAFKQKTLVVHNI